ncbi:hypothetical protein EK21DRAFT_82865, partial [Setomelanomma holmii]
TIFALMASASIAADVAVVWRHEKTTGSTSLSIHAATDDAVLAESCGNSIGSLDFNVDEHGAGNFIIGSNAFDITSQSQEGVSCNRIYNGIIATGICFGVKFDVPEGLATSSDCFTDGDTTASFLALKWRSLGAMKPVTATPVQQPDTPSQTFRLLGDGDPHQNYYHKQLSEVISCGTAPSCAAGYEVSRSYTIGFSAGISADSWISAGFDLQESWTTGNEYTCYGGPGDSVYTVRNWAQNTCNSTPRRYSDNLVMKSPNKANRGGGTYCVIGTCRAQGDAYWDNTGRAGGP